MRHGETDWNVVRRIQGGNSDTPLNENGKRQANAVARYFKEKKIDAIYCSPLQRALFTAYAIAAVTGVKVFEDSDFREIDVGEFEGIELHRLTHDFSEYLISMENGDGNKRLPGGESLLDLRNRVWHKVELISKKYAGSVVIVSHYFAILSIISIALHIPLSGLKLMRTRPAGISILEYDENWRLITFNDTCHLENLEGTK